MPPYSHAELRAERAHPHNPVVRPENLGVVWGGHRHQQAGIGQAGQGVGLGWRRNHRDYQSGGVQGEEIQAEYTPVLMPGACRPTMLSALRP